jgi:hypothetical protein
MSLTTGVRDIVTQMLITHLLLEQKSLYFPQATFVKVLNYS